MESGKKCIVKTNDDLDAIDSDIQDGLSYGIEYYIVSLRHDVCPENPVAFSKLIMNLQDDKKIIFITDKMIKKIKIMEEVFHGDSLVTTLEDVFFWKCPTCEIAFSNM